MTRTRSICKRCHRLRVVDDTRYCATCSSDLRKAERPRPYAEIPTLDETPQSKTTIESMREATVTLNQLADLEQAVLVPPERGGFHFTDGELQLVKNVRRNFDATLGFTQEEIDGVAQLSVVLAAWRSQRDPAPSELLSDGSDESVLT